MSARIASKTSWFLAVTRHRHTYSHMYESNMLLCVLLCRLFRSLAAFHERSMRSVLAPVFASTKWIEWFTVACWKPALAEFRRCHCMLATDQRQQSYQALCSGKQLAKGQGYVGFWCFFCVRDTAATRGQYLALSKAWRSCFTLLLYCVLFCTGGRLLLSAINRSISLSV